MRKLVFIAFAGVLIFALWSIRPVGASHDLVYSPCDQPTGYIHMTYAEFDTAIQQRADEGFIDPAIIYRSNGAPGAAPAGVILSLSSHAGVEDIYWQAGLYSEWYIDARTGNARRYDDPAWGEPLTLIPNFTNWQGQCWGTPLEPLPHPPSTTTTTTTTTQSPTTTTTIPAVATTSTTAPATTTTTAVSPTTTATPVVDLSGGYKLPDGYDLWNAEYDGYPFKKTILLLEQRYPPGTPGKYHFPLSAAVRFLQQGGKIGGLDFLWNSNG